MLGIVFRFVQIAEISYSAPDGIDKGQFFCYTEFTKRKGGTLYEASDLVFSPCGFVRSFSSALSKEASFEDQPFQRISRKKRGLCAFCFVDKGFLLVNQRKERALGK